VVCIFAMLFLSSVFMVAIASPQYALTPRYRRRVGLCQECGYDLVGLGGGATCPECGRPDAASPIGAVRRRERIDPVVSARLVPLMLGAGAAALVFSGAVPVVHQWSYMLQGYQWDVAARARAIRGFDLPEAAWGVVPMCALLAAAPWLAKLPPEFGFGRVALGVLGGGTAVTVLLLAAVVYVSYA
jgi:hypothetical protein